MPGGSASTRDNRPLPGWRKHPAKPLPPMKALCGRRRPRPGDKWHLDEVFVKINGITHYLWRAVDQHGNVLDVLVQSRRNAKAAKRFFRKCSRACGMCRVCW
jgi:transposase-like protein